MKRSYTSKWQAMLDGVTQFNVNYPTWKVRRCNRSKSILTENGQQVAEFRSLTEAKRYAQQIIWESRAVQS